MSNSNKSTKKYFGTDGIRGQANTPPMTADMALKVAMATASVLRSARGGKHMDRVVIGKDTRVSGYMLEQAMSAGFVSMGMDAILIGPIPTPAIAKLTNSLRADVGVMISASHNAYEDNGIKLFGPDGYKLADEIEARIEAKIDADLTGELSPPAEIGKASRLDDALGRYIESLKRSIPGRGTLEGLKVVVDCANGAAYKVAPQVLWELEVDVIAIGDKPNGRNINDGFGATATGQLQEAVVDHGADIGIALDGDADRLIMVNEKGDKIDGDQIMAAMALWFKEQEILKGGGLVATVMSNLGLERFMLQNGLTLERTAVGDRYVVEYMREHGFNLGGEQSGHIVMGDYATTGDGLLAAIQVLNIMKETGKKASEALNLFEPCPQFLKNVRFAGENPMHNDLVRIQIEKAQERFAGKGRILVRPSGTEPLVRVMAEGDDGELVRNIVNDVCEVIEKVAKAG
ncbi:MAG: phosphoglucosamine mutase [Alphaproteobacteria bacterium]|nr:phosphoglucosamine mutase [Alphaproteobacteria bacterium]